jgi:hypothetical protein
MDIVCWLVPWELLGIRIVKFKTDEIHSTPIRHSNESDLKN